MSSRISGERDLDGTRYGDETSDERCVERKKRKEGETPGEGCSPKFLASCTVLQG
jgi:hypothetical protein